jgi:hypothetical protein
MLCVKNEDYILESKNNKEVKDIFEKVYNIDENIVRLNKNYSSKYYRNIKIRKIIDKIAEECNANLYIVLDYCDYVKDTSFLSKCYSLDLCGCINVTDVSELGSVHNLNLNNCENLKDISGLKNVINLNLNNCNNISDICSLISVEKLLIDNSKNIKDVGNLRKLKILEINKKVDGVHYLVSLKKLSVNRVCYKKMKTQIKKLRRINPGVEIDMWG